MIYWDTSCVLKLYVAEPDSDAWMDVAQKTPAPLISSVLLETELACAFRGKEIRNEIKVGATGQLTALFSRDRDAGRFRCSPLSSKILKHSTACVIQWNQVGMLRSLDALHLATCLHLECNQIATTDQRLAEAAESMGIEVITTTL